MTFEELYEQILKSEKIEEERFRKQSFNESFYSSWFDSAFTGAHYARQSYSTAEVRNDPVYKQCIADAIEYFNGVYSGRAIEQKDWRRTMPPTEKERVYNFLKSRLEHYGKEGFIVVERGTKW